MSQDAQVRNRIPLLSSAHPRVVADEGYGCEHGVQVPEGEMGCRANFEDVMIVGP